MKILFRLTYYVWMLCLLFTSCRSDKDYPGAMQKAIACMESDPDSAKIYLASLDSVIADEPEETRMYHALLTTQANDKLYITHTSDSVMQQVVRFYDTYGDADKRMLSYLYLGSVYRDLQDAPRALHAYQLAAEAGQGSTHYQVLARIHYQIGLLFAYQDLPDEFRSATRQAALFYQKAHDVQGHAYALRNIARSYDMLHQTDSAAYYYQQAIDVLKEPTLSVDLQVLLSEYSAFLIKCGSYHHAERLIGQLSREYRDHDAIVLQSIAQLHEKQGQTDSARFYYQQALESGQREQSSYLKCDVHRALARLDFLRRDFESANQHLQTAFSFQDQIAEQKRQEVVTKAHALYNYQRTETKNIQLQLDKQKFLNYISLLFIVVLILLAVIILYLFKKRSLKAQLILVNNQKRAIRQRSMEQLEENRQKILALEQKIEQSNQYNNQLKGQLLEIEKKRLESESHYIQLLQEERAVLKRELVSSDLYKQLSDPINWSPDYLTLERIEEIKWLVDSTYKQFTEQLSTSIPSITSKELLVCCLIKLELPVKGIALLMGRRPSAISNTRKKLYLKLYQKDGTPEDFDHYLKQL